MSEKITWHGADYDIPIPERDRHKVIDCYECKKVPARIFIETPSGILLLCRGCANSLPGDRE